MLTEQQLLKLKEAYAAWFEPGDDVDLSEVARDMTNLVDEVLATRQRAETAEARVKELEAQLTGILPAAQVLVSKVEFIPIPTSNAAADSALLTGTGETSNGGMWKQVESATHP